MEGRATTLAVAAGCVLLTLIFLIAGFPYDRLESRMVRAIEKAIGGRMTYAESDTSFAWGVPGYQWRQVRVTGTSSGPLQFDELSVRPAWSLAWLRGAPAFHVDVSGSDGRIVGVVALGDPPGFDGRLERYDLTKLPAGLKPRVLALRGVADAEVDLVGGEQWMGDVDLSIENGSVSGAKLRLPLAFSKLTGQFELVGDNRTEVSALHIEGPLLEADLVGTVGPAPQLGAAPLDLALELDAEPNALPLLRPLGIRLSKRGPQSLKIGGTFDSPQVR